uniref:Integrase catalytic domain-containing protein n=1 Tax=Cajanus cajan TaxID=3821 RepID=A0A151SJH6_CAJCA|nr:hypothetical protein KK1_001177 [Cajanus cajan]
MVSTLPGHLPCEEWIFLGLFPLAKGQYKFLLLVVDYFTKWIEVEPLATISAQNVQKFL